MKPIAIQNQEDCSKLSGVTKIIVCSPGGKCTTYECNGLKRTIARAIVFKYPGTRARAALKSPMSKSAMIEKVAKLLTTEGLQSQLDISRKVTSLECAKEEIQLTFANFR